MITMLRFIRYRVRRRFVADFGNLSRYREDNARLQPPAPGERRVVFIGDSITDGWDLERYFPGKPYVNRGIGGQTTPQMLIRFRQDVIALRPELVHILAGTNDIGGNTGPMTLQETTDNLQTMVELARLHRIGVVMGSLTPVHCSTVTAKRNLIARPVWKLKELNAWIEMYCGENGLVYADYFGAMADAKGLLLRQYAEDGLHPTPEGYAAMRAVAERAISMALQ